MTRITIDNLATVKFDAWDDEMPDVWQEDDDASRWPVPFHRDDLDAPY